MDANAPPDLHARLKPRLLLRPRNEALYARALAEGLTELQARVLAGRLTDYEGELAPLTRPSLRYLEHPERLADGRRAAERIATAVAEGEHIGILTDYDVDGITSHVVIRRTLVELFGVPESRLHSLIGHRIHDGYGISLPLVERTLRLSPRPTLVITADCCRLAAQHDNEAAAFVVACFSDPGVHALRETTTRPVFGIAESGLLAALTLGDKVGIIAILAASAARHARFIRALGIESRIAGELPVGLGVSELADEAVTRARMIDVGARLRDGKGADVLVMGCAGMARYRGALEDDLGVPVIDPTQAAVAMAIAAVRLGWRTAAQEERRV